MKILKKPEKKIEKFKLKPIKYYNGRKLLSVGRTYQVGNDEIADKINEIIERINDR